jgi:hypothetical protein
VESHIDSLRGGGHPLPESTREYFEPRFGRDLNQVRIHSGSRANAAAEGVSARAFTLGNDVVFGDGHYAPGTSSGTRLLAHELAHVVQQGEEAHPSTVQRDVFPVELVPTSPEESRRLEEQGINLPTVSADTWRIIGGVGNHAGGTLTPQEMTRIRQVLAGNGFTPPASPSQPRASTPEFVLHDTAALVSGARISQMQQQGRGPLGLGIAAWIPRAGATTIARPSFYETQRPSASEYEKSTDIISKANREAAVRQVWQASSASEQNAALTRALNGLSLTPSEIQSESTRARTQLSGTGMVYTTAHWAVRELCERVDSVGAAAVARAPATVANLTAGCNTLAAYLAARPGRIGSRVNVELVQQAGSDCRTTGNLTPLPAYTATQYQGAVLMYLRAALMAGVYPETTTHFWVDRSFRGHCDPRCFNLQHFYDLIASTMGHGIGSRYGPVPNYGTTWGTHNVWWQNTVCGGPPP